MAKPKFCYDNRFADAPPVASSTAEGAFDPANVADWRPYTWWRPAALPATLTVDCGAAKAADYALIYGHDLGSKAATIEIRASDDNFVASDVLIEGAVPVGDGPILLTFAAQSYRYWRVRITGAAAPSLAIVAVGLALTATTWLPPGFDPVGRRVDGRIQRAVSGIPLGRVVDFEAFDQRVTLSRVTWLWVRQSWAPAWKAHLRERPFVFAWDAEAYPDEFWLCQTDGSYETPHQVGGLCDLTLRLIGVAR